MNHGESFPKIEAVRAAKGGAMALPSTVYLKVSCPNSFVHLLVAQQAYLVSQKVLERSAGGSSDTQ